MVQVEERMGIGLAGCTLFILDHVSRAETARHIYDFMLSSKTWFPKVSPWIAPALFVMAVVFFEIERRKSHKKLTHIEPATAPSSLRIEYAGYGVGGGSYQDVTETLAPQIKNGFINVPVSNSTFNCDPFPGKVKHLTLRYVYGGISGRIYKQEGEQLVLPNPRHLLREKVIGLGRDLFAFLREKGPMPAAPLNNLRTTDAQWRTIRDTWDHYVEAIHFGYGRLFRARAVDLFNELAENHISFDLEQYEIEPPQVARETSVRKIAQECFLIAARVDIEDESQGT